MTEYKVYLTNQTLYSLFENIDLEIPYNDKDEGDLWEEGFTLEFSAKMGSYTDICPIIKEAKSRNCSQVTQRD